jgi:hypothetical protein
MELPDPPEGWRLKSLIDDGDKWLAYLYSDTEWVQAAGSTPRFALLDAQARIADGAVYANLTGMAKTLDFNLLSVLKIEPAKGREERRA